MKNLLLVIVLFVANFAVAQKANYTVQETKISKLGKINQVRDLIDKPLGSSEKKSKLKQAFAVPENFIGRRGNSLVVRPELEHQGPDPVRQSKKGTNRSPEPLINIEGINSLGLSDPTGDVGTSHYVQAVNATVVGVFTKEGELLDQFNSNLLWQEVNQTGIGDPIVLFDEMSNRWIITEFAPVNARMVLIAVSETDDPLGYYNAYAFTTPAFPDYPKYGMWPNALVLTTNEQGPGALHNYFIDREALLAGEDEVSMQRIELQGNTNTEAGFYVSTPLDFNGNVLPPDSLPIVMKINDSSWGDVESDRVELFTYDIDFENANNTSVELTNIITTPFDSYPCTTAGGGFFPCIPQPNGQAIDGIPEVIMNVPQYRNFGTHESMVLSFITDVTDGQNLAGIRWMELRRQDGSDWTLFQEGTYAPDDGLHRFMSSIAIDEEGNIALGYNVSSSEEFVGVRYTGRFVNDPLGMMGVDEMTVIDGRSTVNSNTRFGDYSQMSIDPVDERTFWFTTEYAGTNGTNTRIVSFRLEKDNFDAAPLSIVSPESGAELTDAEQVTVVVRNRGLETIQNLRIGLLFEGEEVDAFDIPESLAENDEFEHTFETTLDMSALGDYEVSTYTSFADDEIPSNDTLTTIITHFPNRDGSILAIDDIQSCNEESIVSFTIRNNGIDVIETATLEVTVGDVTTPVDYEGAIDFDQEDQFLVSLQGLVEGENMVSASIVSINGADDEIEDNNDVEFLVNLESGREQYIIQITLDNFPAETSYFFSQVGGQTLAAGAGFTEEGLVITESLCLERDQCYRFTILDSYSDGLCCDFGMGGYQIVGPDGSIVAEGGEFGAQDVVEFCVGMPCMISAEFDVTDASAPDVADGAILITPAGGTEPYQYSIDGGETFSDNNLFTDLLPGDYNVVVTFGEGTCQLEDVVTVDMTTSTDEEELGIKFNISPNPGEGYYRLEFTHPTESYSLKMHILDETGRFVGEQVIQKYNGVFKGDLSLINEPSGIYFLRIIDGQNSKMARVIKLK